VAERLEKAMGEMCRWVGKPKRNIYNLNQTGSKTPKVTKTKEKAMTG
jgi:hypothetical protein